MKNLIPKRRFEEFKDTDPWEQRKLLDEVELYSGLTYSPNDIVKDNGTLVLRSSNVKNGEVIDADNVYVNSEVVNSDNVKEGDIIIVVRNGSRSLIGKHGQIKVKMDNTVIGAFMTGMRSINSNFINALLDTPTFYKEIEMNLGATINQITNGMFHNMYFMFPNDAEQKQIGTFFTNLDHLITLHQRKLAKLKDTKSAYLSEMFPKDGEFYPKRRFAGFTDPWEQRKLGEVLKTESFRPYLKEPEADGKYKIIQQGDNPLVGYANGEPYRDYKKIVLFGDHTLSLYKPKSPFFISTDGVKLLYGTNNLYGNFLLYLLENYKPKTEGYKRYYSILKDQYGYLPSNINEQQKIGVFFMKLDNLITLHQRKLEKLQALKQAYLSEMFV